MGITNPYTPKDIPQPDYGDITDLPPEVKAQLDYARALDAQAVPYAEPEQASPGIRIPGLGRTIPGSAIDRASPALLSVLRSYAPAVRGKNRDLANVASAVGQAFLGSRVAGAQDRARAHAEDLALAKEQRGSLESERRDARRQAASLLAVYRHEKARAEAEAAANAAKPKPMTPEEQIKFKRDSARAEAQGRAEGTPKEPGQDLTPDYTDAVRVSRNGVKWLDTTNLPSDSNGKRSWQAFAQANGVHVVDKNNADRLLAADEVYRSMDDMEALMDRILPNTWQERATIGAMNHVKAATQQDSDAAAFKNTQVLGIRTIQALAAGAGSGFRLNQAEVNLINQRWPHLDDTKEVGKKKLEWERRFLYNKEAAHFGLPYKPLPRIPGLPNPPGMPQEALPEHPMAAKRFEEKLFSAMSGKRTKNSDAGIDAILKEARANGVPDDSLAAIQERVIARLPSGGKR